MVKSSKGFRSRSRGTFTKEVREKGMPPVNRFLRKFEIGDKVSVRIEPSDPHGQPHPRYQGRVVHGGRPVGPLLPDRLPRRWEAKGAHRRPDPSDTLAERERP